ncbi:MAG: 50S ribosomal protein L9 [Holosporales bacterium]|jgi:large subunit ribosomal protein L9|nr:50S ribosomal protein L9 [Holosporales bacterium]
MRQVQVILLQKIGRLGGMGDVVQVKAGYARNYLLPKKLALRATEEDRAYFEQQKEQIAAQYREQEEAARILASSLEGKWVTLIRQASEKGGLYGSVTHRDIADALGSIVTRQQVLLVQPLKETGVFKVPLALHAEVHTFVLVNIAPSVEEAEAQSNAYRRE